MPRTSYNETVYHVTIASCFWETGFDMRRVFHTWYVPNNMVVVAAGVLIQT